MANPQNAEEWIKYHEAMGERAYSLMYDAFDPTRAAGHYSDAKESFAEASRLARETGRMEHAERLNKRIAHIKEVFRSQFR